MQCLGPTGRGALRDTAPGLRQNLLMYLPTQFKAKDAAIATQLIQAHPFASLISVDDEGLPFITHLPLHLDVAPRNATVEGAGEEEGAGLVLLGHCAKPNPHWRYLQARR